ALGYLALVGTLTPFALVAWFGAFGFLSAYVPVLVAHGKALFSPHQVGRGLTVLNMGTMGGTFLAQAISGFVIGLFPTGPDGAYELVAYRLIRPASGIYLIDLSGLFWLPPSPFGDRERGENPPSCIARGAPCPQKGKHRLLFPLLFVRCGVCFCGAVAPGVTVALLGRFLPRLGPLAVAGGPFFSGIVNGCLLGRRPVGPQFRDRDGGKAIRERLEVGGQTREGRRVLETPLVHIKRAVELELDGVQAGGRVAVVLGDEASGIRLVAADRVALRAQRRFDRLRHRRHATGAIAVTEHHVGARTLVLGAGARRHGMTIDQDGRSEVPMNAREQAAQGAVIGLVEPLDSPDRVVDGNALAVDFLGISYDSRNGAQSSRHAHGAGVGEGRQPAVEHARIEFVGLAVDVHVTARKVRPHQRVAPPHNAEAEFVDEAVLGAAQRRHLEPRGGQERARIHASAVRGVEHDRPAPLGRLEDLEGRVELVFYFRHDMLGFDVTCGCAPGPGAFSHHYRWKPVIVHGAKGGCPRGAGFTRYLPGVRLMDAGTKNKGGAGRSLTTPGGLEDGEDYPCRRRRRYAALLGEGAAECRLRRDLLRQRVVGLSTAAGRAVRASAHRHRHAGNGWDRIGAPRLRARSRHQDHVHHRFCGRGAQFRFGRAEKCQGALQASASARARQRGA